MYVHTYICMYSYTDMDFVYTIRYMSSLALAVAEAACIHMYEVYEVRVTIRIVFCTWKNKCLAPGFLLISCPERS